MKMYGTVEIRARPPIHGRTMPRMTGDGTGRQIDATPMKVVARHVGDVGGSDVSREIPSGNCGEIDFEGVQDAGQLIRFKCATKYRRCFDPSIKVRHGAEIRIAARCYCSGPCRQRRHRDVEQQLFEALATEALSHT